MELDDIQFIFNRALTHTFFKKKLLSVSCILLACGLLVVFFRSLAIHAGQWIGLSLTFLPIFLCAGVLLATGIILVRIYHDELKNKPINYKKLLGESWEIAIGAGYLSVPLILGYLLLWMLLGIFFLLNDIPLVGNFFGAVLAFAPFLLNLGAILLCTLSISMLFFVAPVIALRGGNRLQLAEFVAQRCQHNMFFNLFLATIAALPLLLLLGLLLIAAAITSATCSICDAPMYSLIQWFIVMIPFTALLSPAVVFFFNFSAESHVLLQKQMKEGK